MKRQSLLAAVLTLAAYFTIVRDYTSPVNLYWDENYHITSAQRYMNGIFFMEPHPPLGKLLIAAGEALIDANPDDASFIDTEHAKSLPAGFSFAGYRLFPVLLGTLCVPLLFILVSTLTEAPLVASVIALGLAVDNAAIVHFRGAMLEGVQIFFILSTLVALACCYRRAKLSRPLKIYPYLAGASFGAAMATKVTSLIVLPPIIAVVLFYLIKDRRILRCLTLSLKLASSFLITYLAIWQLHNTLAKQVNPKLPNNGYYQLSEVSKGFIKDGTGSTARAFLPLLLDNLKYVRHYSRGVPALNLCKPGENGSTPLLWPLGARAINYRWESRDGLTRYTYLVANPAVWGMGLLGLLVAVAIYTCVVIGLARIDLEWCLLVGLGLAMWLGYMAVMVSAERVMYLYHYLIPLIVSLVLLGLTIPRIKLQGSFRSKLSQCVFFSLGIALLLAGFYIYAPFTYGYPLSDEQVKNRAVLKLWDLRCASCEPVNKIARPVKGGGA
jgi:dolichyl-phosphate-mannose-protein mannosyltransferase